MMINVLEIWCVATTIASLTLAGQRSSEARAPQHTTQTIQVVMTVVRKPQVTKVHSFMTPTTIALIWKQIGAVGQI